LIDSFSVLLHMSDCITWHSDMLCFHIYVCRAIVWGFVGLLDAACQVFDVSLLIAVIAKA